VPFDAVTDMSAVPGAAAGVVVKVSVDELPESIAAGENDAVTPAGSGPVASVTLCADPKAVAVATVADAEPPATTLAAVGESDSEKSAAAPGGWKAAMPLGVPSPVGPS
jgi:hypothetical protein